MHKAVVWSLAVAGVVGLVMALGFEWRGGPDGSALRVGYPDVWAEWESTPTRQASGVHFLRWSFGILVASVLALGYAVRVARRGPR